MTIAAGWIKLHRQMLYSGWLREPLLLTFWIYCLLRANHVQGKVMINGMQLELQPGQFVTGRDAVYRDTGLSEQQYRTCQKRLKSMGSITTKTTNRYTMITVINWNTYQQKQVEANEPTQEPVNARPTSSQRATNDKQEVKTKKDKAFVGSDGKTWTLPEIFNELWRAYPKKDGKKQAMRHFNTTVKTMGDARRLRAALDNYCDHLTTNGTAPQFIKNGSTFFNNWHDWIPDDYKEATP